MSYVTCRMALAGAAVSRVPSRSPSLRGNEMEPIVGQGPEQELKDIMLKAHHHEYHKDKVRPNMTKT